MERLRGKRVNRTQRAIKRRLRAMENGRSSFKKVYLDEAKAFGHSDENSANLKNMQRQLKETRSKTRDFMSQIRAKEVLEV